MVAVVSVVVVVVEVDSAGDSAARPAVGGVLVPLDFVGVLAPLDLGGVLAPPDWRDVIASTRSLLRILVMPVMPMDDATPLSSSSFMADSPDTRALVGGDTKDPSPSFAARDDPRRRSLDQ